MEILTRGEWVIALSPEKPTSFKGSFKKETEKSAGKDNVIERLQGDVVSKTES